MARDNVKKNIEKLNAEDQRLEKTLKRHIGALFEEFDHRVAGIKEGNQETTKQFKEIQRTLKSHQEQIAKILVKTTEIDEKITNLTMDTIEIKRSVNDIKFNVNLRLDNKVDKKHFVDLDKRVRSLEKK